MPFRAKRVCEKFGCNNYALNGKLYCKEHRNDRKKLEDKKYDETVRYERDSLYANFYKSADWVRVKRRALMRDFYLCTRCNDDRTFADVVHHKISIKKAWNLRFDLDNLECLCHSCHNREHKKRGD